MAIDRICPLPRSILQGTGWIITGPKQGNRCIYPFPAIIQTLPLSVETRITPYLTPQRDQSSANRRLKSTPDLGRNPPKAAEKSLNPAFKAASEDDSVVLETLKEFSEASDENPFAESSENFISPIHPVDTHSSETVALSDLTSLSRSCSSITCSLKQVAINETNTKSPEVDTSKKTVSIEAEAVIKHLREARVQDLESKDLGPSKKLLVAITNIIIEEFHGSLYQEHEWLDKLLSRKSNLVTFGMMILPLFMLWFFNSSSSSSESFSNTTNLM